MTFMSLGSGERARPEREVAPARWRRGRTPQEAARRELWWASPRDEDWAISAGPIPSPYTHPNTPPRRRAHRRRREENKNNDRDTIAGRHVSIRTPLEYSGESAGSRRKHFAPFEAPLQDPRPVPRKSSQSPRLCLPENRKLAFALQPPLRRKRRSALYMLARQLQCRPELEDTSRAPATTLAEPQTERASPSH
jgi:hypothetical protein